MLQSKLLNSGTQVNRIQFTCLFYHKYVDHSWPECTDCKFASDPM